MKHLSPAQLADVAEGGVSAAAATHLRDCDACRTAVLDLQATLGDVAATGAAEPSPLFWQHFARRVRAATAGASVPPPRWRWRPVALAAGLAAAVALAVVLRQDRPSVSSAAPPEAAATVALDTAGLDDGMVDVMSEVSGRLSFDEARAANLVPSRTAIALAVDRLNADQTRELLRLVREELGVPE